MAGFSAAGLIATATLCAAQAPRPPPGTGWQSQGVRSGVTTHSKPSPSGHLIFHGSMFARGVHISELLDAVLDDEHATEWVDKLLEIRSGKWLGRATQVPWGTRACEDISFQVFDGPWPVSDREMLMHRTVLLTPSNRTARVVFEPAGEVAGFPVGKDRVRAEATSEFEFVASDRELGTRIALVGLVNPKGSLPTALINLLNRDWAANTISGMLKHVRRAAARRRAGAGPGPVPRGACKGIDLSVWGSREEPGAGGAPRPSWSEWLGAFFWSAAPLRAEL